MRKPLNISTLLLLPGISLMSMLYPSKGNCQLLTNNGVVITMSNGATLTVKGDLQENPGSGIENNGSIELNGNWINNGGNDAFGTSQGTFILNGNNQQLGGNSATVFNNLDITGSGVVILNQDVTVGGGYAIPAGILSLNNQHLNLNGHTLKVSHASPSAITRGSGFIVSETPPLAGYGTIRWQVGSASGNFVFPFGNDNTASFLPVNIAIQTAGTGSGFISLATYATDPAALPNNRPLPAGVTGLTNALGMDNSTNVIDRYWISDMGNFAIPPSFDMSLSYRESEWDGTAGSNNSITESSLLAQRWDGITWVMPQVGSVNTASNIMTLSNVSGFENAAWTFAGANMPLPVELISFHATPQENDKVVCHWKTATEINNDYFTVERSRDGATFESAGIVDGAGNSSSTLTYMLTDTEPFSGTSYYRLKQTDFDGKYRYSAEVPVQLLNSRDELLWVYPVPAGNYLHIHGIQTDDPVTFTLINMEGRVCKEQKISEQGAVHTLDTSLLPSGNYLLKASGSRLHKQLRVAVVH